MRNAEWTWQNKTNKSKLYYIINYYIQYKTGEPQWRFPKKQGAVQLFEENS